MELELRSWIRDKEQTPPTTASAEDHHQCPPYGLILNNPELELRTWMSDERQKPSRRFGSDGDSVASVPRISLSDFISPSPSVPDLGTIFSETSSVVTDISHSSYEIALSTPQPRSPPFNPPLDSHPPVLSAPPSGFDGISSDFDSGLWARAFANFQAGEPKLATAYEEFLVSRPYNTAVNVDLSAPWSVEHFVKQLLIDREKKQWVVPPFGMDITIRKQAEEFVKFLGHSHQVIEKALSTQPHAALAWSWFSLLRPVSVDARFLYAKRLPKQLFTAGTAYTESMLNAFNSIGEIQFYWDVAVKPFLQTPVQQKYQVLIELLVNLYTHIVEFQAHVICYIFHDRLQRGKEAIGSNDWDSKMNEIKRLHHKCRELTVPLKSQEAGGRRDSQSKVMLQSQDIF